MILGSFAVGGLLVAGFILVCSTLLGLVRLVINRSKQSPENVKTSQPARSLITNFR